MSDTQTPSSQKHRILLWFLFGGTLLLIGTCGFALIQRQRLVPGEIIDKFGTYHFPNGAQTLRISRDNSGNVNITVARLRTRFLVISYFHIEGTTTFESEREWFVSVDEYQRLWVFQGHWDRSWGNLRQMPSGGTIPFAPAVILHGLWFTGNGKLVQGTNEITHTGDWLGVPLPFFNRIPGRNTAQWGNVPPIPANVPALSPQQVLLMVNRLRERPN